MAGQQKQYYDVDMNAVSDALRTLAQNSPSAPPTIITAAGAISPHQAASYFITNAGATALTLAAPTAGADDGVTLVVTSATAFAHTLTATGLLNNGSASVNAATFAAHPGASITLQAYNGQWYVLAEQQITFS